MSSRKPRRTFLNPFVVTLATIPALSGACSKKTEPGPTKNPPGPERPPADAAAKPDPDPKTTTQPTLPDPKAATPDPKPAAPAGRSWTVMRTKNDCAVYSNDACKFPPGQPVPPCNPPPPVKYACPPDLMDGASLTIDQAPGAKDCYVHWAGPVKAPTGGRTYNPPAPKKVPCP